MSYVTNFILIYDNYPFDNIQIQSKKSLIVVFILVGENEGNFYP